MRPIEYRTAMRVVLIVAGLLMIFNRSVPLANVVAILLALSSIQIVQKHPNALWGWIGVAIAALTPLLATYWHPNLASSVSAFSFIRGSLLTSVIVAIPLIVGVILIGISMRSSGFFSGRSGTLFALTPLMGLFAGFVLVLGVALIFLGIFYPNVGREDGDH